MNKRSRSQTGRGSATDLFHNYFLGQVRAYCEKMVAACGELHRVHPAFRAGRDPYHAHCDFATDSLARFKEPVVGLHALFRDFLEFPVNSLHYYPLMLSLCQASEQEQRLQTLISSYRQVCQTNSPQLVHQKLAIYDALERLIECSQETLTRIEHFINETRFLNQTGPSTRDDDLPASNERNVREDDEFTAADTDMIRDTVPYLQEYWPHASHRYSQRPQQLKKIRTCSSAPAQKDGV